MSLRPHQREALAALFDLTLLHGHMGSGKTAISLQWLSQFDGPRLIICPKPALYVWSEDLNNPHIFPSKPIDAIIDIPQGGNTKQRARRLREAFNPQGVYVINYESAWRLGLDAFPWTAVVTDEGHRLGQYNSKQSLALTKQLSQVPHKLTMTGTPYHDGYHKIYGMLRWLDPIIPKNKRAYPKQRYIGSWQDFLNQYCLTYELSPGVRPITGYRNLDALANIMAMYLVHIPQDVVDLPPLTIRNYYAPLRGELRKAYKDLENDYLINADELHHVIVANNPLTRHLRLHQLATSGRLLSRTFDGLQDRVKILRMLLEDSGSDPVVIFTRYDEDVKLLSQEVQRLNEEVHYLTGSIDTHEAWRKGQGRVLIANIAAGSVAVRLERASLGIFWSVGYSAGDYAQAISRLWRPGGKRGRHVMIYNIISQDTVEEKIYEAFKQKEDWRNELKEALQNV